MAYQRLTTILIGGTTCMIISIFVFPVWAGEDLHKLIVDNIQNLAISLEGIGDEFSRDKMSPTNTKTERKAFLHCHKSVLTSKNTEECLANFAHWEPCHGRFRFCHPWNQYQKIGALTRQCAYQLEALCGFINLEAKAPLELRRQIKNLCTKMAMDSSLTLRALSTSIKTMTQLRSSAEIYPKSSKYASEEHQNIIKSMLKGPEDLVALIPDAIVASKLIEIVESVEKLSEAVDTLSKLAHFKLVHEPTVSPETTPTAILGRGIVSPVYIDDGGEGKELNHVVDIVICIQEPTKHGNCAQGEF